MVQRPSLVDDWKRFWKGGSERDDLPAFLLNESVVNLIIADVAMRWARN